MNNDSGRVAGYHVKVGQRETLQGVLRYERGNVTGLTETQKGRELLAKTLVFNDKNQLTSVTVNDAKNRFNANTRYAYDYAGRREMMEADGKKTYYLYGEALDPLMELNGEGEIRTFHIYIGSRRLATISGDELDFYHSDELDNVLKVTDEKGEEVQSVRYDPFGNINFLAGSSSNNYLFAGKPYDQPTGLVYFGARYYDPQLGRFLSRDPLLQGTNHYSYANNNPLSGKDLFGLYHDAYYDDGIYSSGISLHYDDYSYSEQSYVPQISITSNPYGPLPNLDRLPAGAYLSPTAGYAGGQTSLSSDNPVLNNSAGVTALSGSMNLSGQKQGYSPYSANRTLMPNMSHLNYYLDPNAFFPSVVLKKSSEPESLKNQINLNPMALLNPAFENGAVANPSIMPVVAVLDPPNNEVNFGGSGSVDSHREGGGQQDLGGNGGAENGDIPHVNPRLPAKFSPVNPVTAGGFTERPEDKPSPSVQATGGNPPAPGAVAVAGMPNTTDPILLHSGDLLQTETDLKIPGRGIDFEFTRTYRSRVVYDGPLGWGWDHNYNKRLVEQEGGNIARLDGNARFDIYVKNGDGSYVSPSGYFDTLTVVREEAEPHRMISAAIRDKFGTVNTYAADGWITQIADRNGNTMTFGYEEIHDPLLCKEGAGEVDHCRRLKTVTDTLGRNITFGYEGRRITSLTDFTDRAVGFAYDNGDLISVTDPADHTTRYAYSSGYLDDRDELNHNLRTVTDAKGQIYLRNEYSIYDRVVVQQFGDEGKFRMEYHQVASSLECTPNLFGNIFYRTRVRDRVGNLVDYTFNCQGNPLEVIRHTRGLRQGDPAQYVTRYRYNPQGLLERLEQPRGNAMEYDYDPTTGNMLAMRRLPAPGAQGLGVLTTAYEYDPNFSRLISVTDPENHTTTFTIDPQNGDITQKCLPPLDPPPPAVGGGQGEVICETYQYNAHGQLERLTDDEGNTDSYAYDANGYLSGITRGVGATNLTNEFTRDERGNILSFTDGRRNVFNFEVDLLNQVTIESGPGGYGRLFEYDANKNLIRIEGASSPTTTFTYNILDRVVTKEETIESGPDGAARTALTEYQYDLNENLTRVVDPEGNSTFIEYDERDLPWRVTKGYRTPEASTQTFAFDANGNVESLRDGKGNTVNYQYDGHDRLAQVIDPLQNKMELGYDGTGNVEVIRRLDAEETELSRTEFVYDALNRLIERRTSNTGGDVVTQYAYNHTHQLTQLTDPKGNATQFTYDAADRLTEKLDALGNTTRYGYDGNGNLATEESHELPPFVRGGQGGVALPPEIFTNSFEYDALNRPASRTDNAGNVTAYEYDARGNLAATTDAEGNVVSYCYDGLNRLIEEVKGLQALAVCGGNDGIRTQYGHDDNGRITQVTDANGHATRFTYDALNRQTWVELADGGRYAKRYDGNGNIIEETDPKGYKVASMYDEANRLVEKSVTLQGAPAGHESFTYDGLSRLLSAKTLDPFGNQTSSADYAYDKLSRVLSESVNGHAVAKSYDGVGNITERVLPSGRRVAYGFDALNRLTGITDNGLLLLNTSYRGRGRVEQKNFGNGIQTDFSYDNLKRLVSQTTTLPLVRGGQGGVNILAGFAYGYDKVGNRLYEQRTHDQNLARVFEYDSLYRLTQSKAGIPNPQEELANPGSQPWAEEESWELDSVDNWLTRTQSLPLNGGGQGGVDERVQQFNSNEVNAYTSLDGQAFVYDANGNLTEDGTNRYEYNHRNLLTRVVNKADATEVASYGYDALGRRISKTVVGAMTRYVYEGVQVIAELGQDANGGDQITKEFVYGDSIDDPVAMVTPAEYHYYHTDAQGSIVALTNAAGEVSERYSYDAYGDPEITDAATGAVMEESAAGNPFLYTGQRYDSETGFYYYKARYYHPTLGRFLQRDPLGYIDGYNLYAYVKNNPVNFVDPLGTFTISLHRKITRAAINKLGGIDGVTSNAIVQGVIWNDLPGNMIYFFQTHYGSKQHWHFMKNGEETLQQVQQKVLAQAQKWYSKAMEFKETAEINKQSAEATTNVFKKALMYESYQKNMARSGYYVGHIGHIVEDGQSGGHTQRDPMTKTIIELYDYGEQDHSEHSVFDRQYSPDAVEDFVSVLEQWQKNASWKDMKQVLENILSVKTVNGKKNKNH